MSSRITRTDDTINLFHLKFSLEALLQEIRDTCYSSPILYMFNDIKETDITQETTLNDIQFVYYPYIELDICKRYSLLKNVEENAPPIEDINDEDIFLGVILLQYSKGINSYPEDGPFDIENAECDSYPCDLDRLIKEMKDEHTLRIDEEACSRFLRFFDV